MELLVPWRFLLPCEAHDDLCTTSNSSGSRVEVISERTGARIDVDTTGSAAAAFGGAILTMHGTMWQKRTAGRQLVDRLFELQGIDPLRWATSSGWLSIVLPASTHSAVASEKTRASVEVIGSRPTVLEPISEAPRYLVKLEGNAQQVISGVTRINTVMQDLADHAQLHHADFVEEAGQAPPSIPDVVRSARLAPAAGVATQAPHSHPAFAPSVMPQQSTPASEFREEFAGGSYRPPYPATHGNAAVHTAREQNTHNLMQEAQRCPALPWKQADWVSNHSLQPAPCAKLSILLPQSAITGALLPRSQFTEIAQRCGVQIDLGDVLADGMRVVTLTGPLVANSLAIIHVQWRMAQWGAVQNHGVT